MINKELRKEYITKAIEEREHELVHIDYMRQYYLTKGAKDALGSDMAEAQVKQLLIREGTIKDQLIFFNGIKI